MLSSVCERAAQCTTAQLTFRKAQNVCRMLRPVLRGKAGPTAQLQRETAPLEGPASSPCFGRGPKGLMSRGEARGPLQGREQTP
mmetsp:Transcript_15776/g.27756  ORF Transcript_15776/g.27756 Transcript_15776/m.27756 type:complete len:84 (-) Transcript_15776:50-301(-)